MLLDACTRHTPLLWSRAAERLLRLDSSVIDDESLADAHLRLRRKLLRVITTKKGLDRTQEEQVSTLSRIFVHLTPKDLLIRHAWLFGNSPPLPDIFDGKWDHERHAMKCLRCPRQGIADDSQCWGNGSRQCTGHQG